MHKFLIFALLSLLSGSLLAEESRVGLGVGISDNSLTLRMPIAIDPELRIEPEFDFDYTAQSSQKQLHFTLGTGFHVLQQQAVNTHVYFGGKTLIDYDEYDLGSTSKTMTRLILGGVVGFEYAFDANFTLGGEASLLLGLGDYTTLNTRGEALLRYYF